MIYYTSRAASEKLNINLAKWKRWAREFLPPDPLGGMQSGYARQYHPDQAFKVFLGGHLVADQKYSIPDARQIMTDLSGWLEKRGFFYDLSGNRKLKPALENSITEWQVFIFRNPDGSFAYRLRGLIGSNAIERNGCRLVEEKYLEDNPGTTPAYANRQASLDVKLMLLTSLLHRFAVSLGIAPEHYHALERLSERKENA